MTRRFNGILALVLAMAALPAAAAPRGVGAPLLLGTFTHYNATIPIPNLTAVDLDVSFDTNGVPAAVGAVFPFAQNETPNNTGASPADDDIVTITTPIVNVPVWSAPISTSSICLAFPSMAAARSRACSARRKAARTRRCSSGS